MVRFTFKTETQAFGAEHVAPAGVRAGPQARKKRRHAGALQKISELKCLKFEGFFNNQE